ncbi:uncharacterized protein LOC104908794 isoform X2 [Beta vulgaris subsp. vulgaris]|uniref:uncharacterized protein LOC104908794 isoform X2 n=2 Tax=Beta vulgaris subsp. vulgaris TaxID=3555 RepID=UPI0005401057|nr:uncharacterized protein LOC104908794 isoform X2 [Beta vulgaris subsp. vulgaris]
MIVYYQNDIQVKRMKELDQGYNIGNLIARSIIEFCDGAPRAKNFISLAGPHVGIAAPPFGLFRELYSAAAKFINFGIYGKFIQKNLAASGYIKIPYNIPSYLRNSKFLPKLNNELSNERNSTYKERFESLENLVLIKFDNENVLQPKETSWFGYHPDCSFSSVLSTQETKLFIEDWIGLKALEEAGNVTYITLPGVHLEISDDGLKKYIVPYLKNKNLTWHNASTPHVLLPNWKPIILTIKRQCPIEVQVIRR